MQCDLFLWTHLDVTVLQQIPSRLKFKNRIQSKNNKKTS